MPSPAALFKRLFQSGPPSAAKQVDINLLVKIIIIGNRQELVMEAKRMGYGEEWAERVWKLYRGTEG
jgi:hypothetical protein